MQYLYYKSSNRQAKQLTLFSVLMLAGLVLWFHPHTSKICHAIDSQAFLLLNGSLKHSTALQYFFGYLNHPSESWLNVIFMAATNILGIYSLKPSLRTRAFVSVLYFWAFFQIVLFGTHAIFSDLLHMHRSSPSLTLPLQVPLHTILEIPKLRIFSTNCFPAGHTLVAVYWCFFSRRYAAEWVRLVIYTITILLILPRLFCGAHWLSDVLFTICYALVCLEIAKLDLFYKTSVKYLTKTLNFIGIKQQRATQAL